MRRVMPLLVVLGALAVAPAGASAGTFVVNNANDAIASPDCSPGSSTCTLRAALVAADLPCACAANEIDIAPGTYAVSTSLPIVTQTVVITGTAGAASTIIDGRGVASLLDLEGGPMTEVSGVTLRNGYSTLGGAGLYLAHGGTLHASVVRDNVADGADGGGISAAGPLIVSDATITGNHASAGAGIWSSDDLFVARTSLTANVVDDPSGAGGAIADCGCVGTETITSSLIAGNSAPLGGGVALSRPATIVDSTLASNDAPGLPGLGAAAYGSGGNIALVSSTVAANRGTSALHDVGSVSNTIIGPQAFGPSCSVFGSPMSPDGQNIDSGHTCSGGAGPHWLSDTDPRLQPLADNGGPTQTMALTTGSPAIDAADSLLCTGPAALDQRGVPRTGLCDIGAFEGAQAVPGTGSSAASAPAVATAAPPAAAPPADQAASVSPSLPAPPPTTFIDTASHIAADGSVVVALNAPGAGPVTVTFTKGVQGSGARATKRTSILLATGETTAKAAGPIRVAVHPNAAGRRALKGRRALYVLLTARQGRTSATRTVLLTKRAR